MLFQPYYTAGDGQDLSPLCAGEDLLLPPSLRDWLPEGHLAFFVNDLIDQLDLSAITTVYGDEERGYASEDYQRILDAHGITCSMSRRGDCYDNR